MALNQIVEKVEKPMNKTHFDEDNLAVQTYLPP